MLTIFMSFTILVQVGALFSLVLTNIQKKYSKQ
jgi:hypothetical protein